MKLKRDKLDELLDIAYINHKLLKENNKLLKQIIKFINYYFSNVKNDNEGEFVRNIFANVVSNMFPFSKR